jgi:hypothetical protein
MRLGRKSEAKNGGGRDRRKEQRNEMKAQEKAMP